MQRGALHEKGKLLYLGGTSIWCDIMSHLLARTQKFKSRMVALQAAVTYKSVAPVGRRDTASPHRSLSVLKAFLRIETSHHHLVQLYPSNV